MINLFCYIVPMLDLRLVVAAALHAPISREATGSSITFLLRVGVFFVYMQPLCVRFA